ncbi:MAG: endonuclease/exonuclease/phosphatase family protein [Nitrospirae bacterium]|nr:endonuclease/exonuclease/phosphatase family protein [Nitrospirota bacterium]
MINLGFGRLGKAALCAFVFAFLTSEESGSCGGGGGGGGGGTPFQPPPIWNGSGGWQANADGTLPAGKCFGDLSAGAEFCKVESGNYSDANVSTYQPNSVRLISWNVAHGEKLDDMISKFQTESNLKNASIINVQEIYTESEATGNRNAPRELAKALRMNYYFCREFSYAPGYSGNAVLSKFPLHNPQVVRHIYKRELDSNPPLGTRCAMMVDVSISGRLVRSVSAHLEVKTMAGTRKEQGQEIIAAIPNPDFTKMHLVSGDFNTAGGELEPVVGAFKDAGFTNVEGSGITQTIFHLDYIFVRGFPSGTKGGILSGYGISDHKAEFVDFDASSFYNILG